jgi:DUF1365 family protein
MSLNTVTPRLVVGQVWHTRHRPVTHRLRYPGWFLMLPLRRLRREPMALLHRNRRALVAFHDADHGDGGTDCLDWIEAMLAREGIDDADGEIWLQTMPRVLGHAFKPVSFWYCHRQDGSLRAIVAEVNNTFGERHFYVLAGPRLAWGQEQRARKVFHVSPFCEVDGAYRFRFMRTDLNADECGRVVVRIDHDDPQGPLLATSVSGASAPLTPGRLRAVMWRMPLAVVAVMLRIHWQALQLWLKGVPWHSKPAAPEAAITR